MLFSVWPHYEKSPAEAFERAKWADAAGWHGVWYADHYMPNTGSEHVVSGDTYECWAMLPALAALTENLRVGSLVAPTSVHHPAVLANRAATIDHISNGRMVLGLGAGWQINEHKAYGIALEPPRARVDRFEEAIQIIRSLLHERRTTFAGNLYQLHDAPSDPDPIQNPLPILVGTGGERMMRITARYATEWNTWGTPDQTADTIDRFRMACSDVGRDFADFHNSVQAMVALCDTDAERDAALATPFGSRTIAGSADHIIEQISRYAEQGFHEFIVPEFTLGDSRQERQAKMDRFHTEVATPLMG